MNYLGGKFRLAPRLVQAMREDSSLASPERVLELCAGAGNVTYRLADWAGYVIAVEAHSGLVALMRKVQAGWTPPTTCTRELRESCTDYTDPLHAFYRFACGYGGAWDAGFVPDKPARVIVRSSGKNINAGPEVVADTASRSLRKARRDNVEWVCEDALTYAPTSKIDLVYIDPPYEGSRGYACVRPASRHAWWRRARDLATMLHVPVYVSEASPPPLDEVSATLVLETRLGQRRLHAGGGERVEMLWRVHAV